MCHNLLRLLLQLLGSHLQDSNSYLLYWCLHWYLRGPGFIGKASLLEAAA